MVTDDLQHCCEVSIQLKLRDYLGGCVLGGLVYCQCQDSLGSCPLAEPALQLPLMLSASCFPSNKLFFCLNGPQPRTPADMLAR